MGAELDGFGFVASDQDDAAVFVGEETVGGGFHG